MGFARVYAREPSARHDGVHCSALRRAIAQTTDNGQLLAERFERFKDGREFIAFAFGRRCPAIHDRAMRKINEAHAHTGTGCRCSLSQGGACRDHGIEQRQRDRQSGSPEKGATRQVFAGDKHAVVL